MPRGSCFDHLAAKTSLDKTSFDWDYASNKSGCDADEPAASRFIIQCAACRVGVVFLAYDMSHDCTQDHLLPFCLDEKHAPDTLFIVLEEDWRLREADCQLAPTRRKPGLREKVPQAPGLGGESSEDEDRGGASSSSALGAPAGTGEPAAPVAPGAEVGESGRWLDASRGFWEWCTLPTEQEATVVSRTL